MGTIDKLWVKLTCKGWKVTETDLALDCGSGYRGSNWDNFGPFKQFNVICEGRGEKEPTVVSAKCKMCGKAAMVQTGYGFNRPTDF